MSGWIKLHRKLLTSNIFQNEKLLKVFTYCLLKATHTDHQQMVGKQKVALEPGQFVFGRRKAALELDMKESTVRDYMKVLKDDNVIAISPTNKFSVVSIVNWEIYQSRETDDRQQSDSKPTTEGQQNDTNKNVKNDKNEKNNKKTSRPKLKFETHHLKLAELLFKKVKENNPAAKEPNLETWANTFRLMMERDERAGKEIQDLILWSQGHHFWYKNILSADKLRKQYDRLLLEMKDDQRKPLKVIAGGKAEAPDDGYNYGF
ncbi:Replication protein O [Oceanobacillus alkalisoli]|uniref:Replication protein O n=1 Tax=Oceanobacillus alkalisoli TaxID=2925113 RepID=UPI001F11A3D8|nr:Replication protein O [Oceanobacillus alkalisoli]MCF3942177.1 Replication protein O [Oceanobacillus alkalisoli]